MFQQQINNINGKKTLRFERFLTYIYYPYFTNAPSWFNKNRDAY